jgi:two-component system OmpR family sensor kinase
VSPASGASALRRFWRGLPLRIQLVAVVLALVVLALAVTAAAATTLLRGQLIDRIDSQLQASVNGISALGGGGPSAGAGGGPPQLGPSSYLGIFAGDGRPLTSFSLRVPYGKYSSGPQLPQLTYTDTLIRQGQPFTVDSTDQGSGWRVQAQALPNGRTFVVGQSLDDVDSTLNQLRSLELVVSLIVLALLAGIAYAVVRTSLRRLVAVEQTAGAIAAGDLSRRVPEDRRTEVGRLGLALNAMLTQIEAAFRDRSASEEGARASEERMRRFVADASHELRTPLTSIRGFAELHRQGAVRDPAAVADLLRRIESEAQRMGLLVDDLLLLARLDQQRPLERKPVDLLHLASEAVSDAGTIDRDRPVRLRAEGLENTPPVVLGDEARLRQVLGNLMSNARRHTPPASPVTVRVAVEGAEAVLDVIDSGPGLAPEDARRVFERFYRADPSRTRGGAGGAGGTGSAAGRDEGAGSGLGLSIVAALVAAHAGRVEVRTEPGRGATFSVRLPLLRT